MDSCGSEDSEPSLFNEIAPYLSADECSVLVFKFEFGMTIRDIGKVMDVPKSSVQDIYKKALEKTKRHLEKGETS
jgi:Sigma-70, region 4.